jgi:hypothetical protein
MVNARQDRTELAPELAPQLAPELARAEGRTDTTGGAPPRQMDALRVLGDAGLHFGIIGLS